MSNARRTTYAALRAVRKYPLKLGAGALTVTTTGALLTHYGVGFGPEVTCSGVVAVAGNTTWWWVRNVSHPLSTQGKLDRKAARKDATNGVATRVDIADHASAGNLKARAGVLRPSMRGMNRLQLTRVNPRELGVVVARVGPRWIGQNVWTSCEDITARIGGPRTGKTQSLACHGLDAPGALVTTSTRLDLAEAVNPARKDRAVHVFNPVGLGGVPSTVRWSVLTDCDDYRTAARRAADLIPESFGEGERWDNDARRILGLFLHAAAIKGGTCRDVQRWLGSESADTRDEVEAILQKTPGGIEKAQVVHNHWANAQKTRQCINGMVAKGLAWLSSNVAREIGDAPAGTTTFDVARLIRERETLHILGHESRDGTAPLIAAIVAEIGHQARMISAEMPGGRLDPPLTMLLDEVAIICPIPLVDWTSDMGGRGVTMHIAVQSLAQLRNRWGDDGASAIINNVATLITFGGGRDADDLDRISRLTGERRRLIQDADGPAEYRVVRVMSVSDIASLGPGEVLVLHRGMPPVVGHVPMVRDRRGWKPVALTYPALRELPAPAPVPTAEQLMSGSKEVPL